MVENDLQIGLVWGWSVADCSPICGCQGGGDEDCRGITERGAGEQHYAEKNGDDSERLAGG